MLISYVNYWNRISDFLVQSYIESQTFLLSLIFFLGFSFLVCNLKRIKYSENNIGILTDIAIQSCEFCKKILLFFKQVW